MKAARQLADAFFEHHPTEAAGTLEEASRAEIGMLLSEMDSSCAAPVVAAMDQAVAAHVVGAMDPGVAARIVQALPPHAAGMLLRRVTPRVRSAVLQQLPSRDASRVAAMLHYPEGSAGALLDPSVQTAPPDLTAEAMMERLRTVGGTMHFYLYVVDRRGVLIGVATLRELIGAPPHALVGAIANRRIATLPATARHAAIVTHPAWQDLRALPVVDREGRFLGIVRHQTVRELESGDPARALEPALTGLALDIGELAWTEGATLLGDLFDVLCDAPASARPVGTMAG